MFYAMHILGDACLGQKATVKSSSRAVAAAAAASAAMSTAAGSALRFLVVDDVSSNRKVLPSRWHTICGRLIRYSVP